MSDDHIQELVDIFRRRQKRHRVNARSKKNEVVKNYHLGHADAYEICADQLELALDHE